MNQEFRSLPGRATCLVLLVALVGVLAMTGPVGCTRRGASGASTTAHDTAVDGEAAATSGDRAIEGPAQNGETPMESRVVEVACGQCQFGLPGESCDLAVRIDGHAYFVDGTGIDDHGDAHADDGFCNAVSSAEVVGQLRDGRFAVTSLRLLPSTE